MNLDLRIQRQRCQEMGSLIPFRTKAGYLIQVNKDPAYPVPVARITCSSLLFSVGVWWYSHSGDVFASLSS
jgi:hypothetical protein